MSNRSSWPGSVRFVGCVKPTSPIFISLYSWWVSPTLRFRLCSSAAGSWSSRNSMARSMVSNSKRRSPRAGAWNSPCSPVGLVWGASAWPWHGKTRMLAVKPLERLVGAQDVALPGRGDGHVCAVLRFFRLRRPFVSAACLVTSTLSEYTLAKANRHYGRYGLRGCGRALSLRGSEIHLAGRRQRHDQERSDQCQRRFLKRDQLSDDGRSRRRRDAAAGRSRLPG